MHFRIAQRWETRFGKFLANYPVSGLVSDLSRHEQTRVTTQAVYQWVSGRRIPRPPVALEIERLSRGQVTLIDIYSHRTELARLRTRSRRHAD